MTAMPVRPSELADILSDPVAASRHAGGSPAEWREFNRIYAAKALAADPTIERQVAEQVQVGIAEFLKANPSAAGRVPLAPGAGRSAHSAAMYNKNAPGAAVDSIWSGPGELFAAVAANHRGHADPATARKLGQALEIQASYGSEVPADGGFLIPETVRSDILQMSLEESVIRSRATVIPMNSLRVPIPMIDDTSHASSVLGGIVFTFTEESASITESQASFGRVVLDARKLAGYFLVPNELLADAPAFGGFFNKVVPAAHAWFEDLSFMTGTGAGEPQGFVNCTAAVTVSKETGQPAATLVYENLAQMWSQLLPQAMKRAIWVANVDVFKQLATMALSVGTGGGPVWIGGNPLTGGVSAAETPPATIFGRPVFFTEKLKALGTSGDVCLLDPSFYLVGDRQILQVAVSEHVAFQQDRTAFRLLSRLDGRPWLQAPLTPHVDAVNQLSAFVQLQSR